MVSDFIHRMTRLAAEKKSEKRLFAEDLPKENGNWEKIDCKMGAVPATMVPCNVATFMKDYYPRIPIVKIEKTDNGYETTLSNFVSLKFNMAENVA